MPLLKDSDVTILVKDMDKAISFSESIGLITKNRWGNLLCTIDNSELL